MRRPDDIDRKILQILQSDGRITNQDLCRRVNLSPRACLERVRRLERDGMILGYRAVIGRVPEAPLIVVHTEVTLVDQRQTTMQQFEARALKCPEVIACHLVSGPYDYLVRFACRDLEHYQRISDGWINDLAMGVARIVSHTELKTVKEFAGYPIG